MYKLPKPHISDGSFSCLVFSEEIVALHQKRKGGTRKVRILSVLSSIRNQTVRPFFCLGIHSNTYAKKRETWLVLVVLVCINADFCNRGYQIFIFSVFYYFSRSTRFSAFHIIPHNGDSPNGKSKTLLWILDRETLKLQTFASLETPQFCKVRQMLLKFS